MKIAVVLDGKEKFEQKEQVSVNQVRNDMQLAADVLNKVRIFPHPLVKVLFCSVLFCVVLFCFVLLLSVLFCFVLFCFVLFCSALFCFVLFCLFCVVLFFSV